MQPHSAAYEADLRGGGGESIVRVEILEAGVTIRSSTVALDALKVGDGRASSNRRSSIRRSWTTTLADETGALVPLTEGDLLDPRTQREVRISRGRRMLDPATLLTTDELIPLVTGPLFNPTVTEDGGLITIELAGEDRAGALADNPWIAPFTVAAATPVEVAIDGILTDRMPTVTARNLQPTAVNVPSALTFGAGTDTDPLIACHKLAESAGAEFYFDAAGIPTLRPIPNPATDSPAWTFLEDEDDLLVHPLSRSIDYRTYRNGVVVKGEAPWLLFPVQGEAWYVDGEVRRGSANRPANPRPETINDALVGTNTQAEDVAAAKVRDYIGIEEEVRFSGVPVEFLEPSDVIEIESAIFGGVATLVIENLDHPTAVADSMTGTARRRA